MNNYFNDRKGENTRKGIDQFYPTPFSLLEKITEGMDWESIYTVLEPSAGKGNIVDFVIQHLPKRHDIDCIEINPELQAILKGKGYRVVGDDFLKFRTIKRYNLIIMNPPFSEGAMHLRKAIEMQKYGGSILCILNAETINNPYSNQRKELLKILEDYGADISFFKEAFQAEDSERETSVEIAVIKVVIPSHYDASILEGLRSAFDKKVDIQDATSLSVSDYVQAIVDQFNFEAEVGRRIIYEYRSLRPYMLSSIKDNAYKEPMLFLNETDENVYLKKLRKKYWEALFLDKRFVGNMTKNQYETFKNMLSELVNYDFSYYNIKNLQISMCESRIEGIENAILDVFDRCTRHYWFPECEKNTHFYDGWSTNKAYIIEKKVILPMKTFDPLFKKYYMFSGTNGWDCRETLTDMEKVFNYLKGNLNSTTIGDILRSAQDNQQLKKIDTKYMILNFYKKGTVHIEFKDLDLLKKLNIFAGRKKGWLPYSYGTKTYSEMDARERAVVDSFHGGNGKQEYDKIMKNPKEYFLNESSFSLPLLA